MLKHSHKKHNAHTLWKRNFFKFLDGHGWVVDGMLPIQKNALHESETKLFELWMGWMGKSSKKHFR